MTWRFRKSKNIGSMTATVSKKGVGTSFSFHCRADQALRSATERQPQFGCANYNQRK
jgi:hypothetical protein